MPSPQYLEERVRYAITLVAFCLMLSPVFSSAEMYRYTDGAGQLHFVDSLDRIPRKYRAKARSMDNLPDLSVVEAPPARTRSAPSRSTTGLRQEREPFRGTVKLYMTSWCGYCRKAEQYLQKKGIPYVAYDIEKDEQARQRHHDLGGSGVPLIVIGDHKINGFSASAIDYYTGR